MTKLTVAFRNTANAPKNGCEFSLIGSRHTVDAVHKTQTGALGLLG